VVKDTFRIQHDVQLVFTPGVLLNPSTVVYGRFGAAFAQIKLTFRADATIDGERFLTDFCQSGDCERGPYESPGEVLTERFDRVGFVVGTGIRKQVGPHFGVMAEYQYTNYGKVHWAPDDEYIIGGSNLPAGAPGRVVVTVDELEITHRLDSNAFKIGVFFTF